MVMAVACEAHSYYGFYRRPYGLHAYGYNPGYYGYGYPRYGLGYGRGYYRGYGYRRYGYYCENIIVKYLFIVKIK